MCELSPVRKVLSRYSVKQVESARATALVRSENARAAGDGANAELFASVAQECSDELADRLLVIATRTVVDESAKRDQDAAAVLSQMTR